MKNNKGFSLIELIIVIAIMALLSGLSVVTFAMANRQRPNKVMNNVMNYAKYSKSLVQSYTKDFCMVIMKCDDNNYYVFHGTATGDTQSALRTSFRPQNMKQVNTDATSTETVLRNQPDDSLTLTELAQEPTKAGNYHSLGSGVTITYKDESGAETVIGGTDTALVVQFSKFDGSVKHGAGTFIFSKYHGTDPQCSIVLEGATGAFHKE